MKSCLTQEIIDTCIDQVDFTDEMTLEEFEKEVNDNNLLDVDVMYYSKAIEYLSENDASLTISLGLAHDMGYTTDKINSELLASLLKTDDSRECFNDNLKEIYEAVKEAYLTKIAATV